MNREVADAARRLVRAVESVRRADGDPLYSDITEVVEATADLMAELRRLNLIPAVL